MVISGSDKNKTRIRGLCIRTSRLSGRKVAALRSRTKVRKFIVVDCESSPPAYFRKLPAFVHLIGGSVSGLNLFGIEGGWGGIFLCARRRAPCCLRASILFLLPGHPGGRSHFGSSCCGTNSYTCRRSHGDHLLWRSMFFPRWDAR